MAPSLRQELSEFFGRARIALVGADPLLGAAERALADRDYSLALRHAEDLLREVPRSPVALVIAADAAEGAWLDDRAADYLARLAEVVPWRSEIWIRLGAARRRAGRPAGEVRDALARATADLSAPDIAARAAVLLAELDLDEGDPARALAWLARAGVDPEAIELRATALLETGDEAGARLAAEALDPPGPLDGRRNLLFGRLAARSGGDPSRQLLRAYLLDVPGSSQALAAWVAEAGTRAPREVRDVVEAKGELERPIFRAAFARASGDVAASLEALLAASAQGDLEASTALARASLEARDPEKLRAAHDALLRRGVRAPDEHLALADAATLVVTDPRAALDRLDAAGEGAWAADLRDRVMRGFAPTGALASVPDVLGEIRRAARALDDVGALLATEALAVEAERPLRVAVMGEFNAGKSTFVNALLGADIAPTGVLPTTATLHHVVFSPDPFARVVVKSAPERVVSPERLRAAIREVQSAGGVVQRVTIGLPLERLRHVELIDTPGFNAPDVAHASAAKEALAEVHLAIWLLDAVQPWKETERVVLADVRAEGVPAQVLVNKIDRVPDEERGKVMAYVAEQLAATGLASLAGVVAFSSREALRGRLGDEAALARSGWGEVEKLVEEVVVARAPLLKDAAIRRRARSLLAGLLARAREKAAQEIEAARSEAEGRAKLLEAATALERDRAKIVLAVARALDAPLRALADDLAPLAVADVGRGGESSPAVAYASSRAVQRLARPLVEATVEAVLPPPLVTGAIDVALPVATAAVRAYAAAQARAGDVASSPTERLVVAIVPSIAEALQAESARWTARERSAAPLAARLAALDRALAG